MAEIPAPARLPRRFGSFELDPNSGELRKAGMLVGLQEQSLKVLVELLERPGDLVTREQLRQRLWPNGTFVDFEHGLNAVINRLRETLGDSAESPRFIQTVPRRGYRFIAPVETARVDARADNSASTVVLDTLPGGRTGLRPRIAGGAALVTIATVAIGAIWLVRPSPPVESAPPRVVPLTRLAGSEWWPAFAPDGEQVAFAWSGEKEDNWDIYLKLVDSPAVRRLTTQPGRDTAPSWSPDGREIAFLRDGHDGQAVIAVSPVTGTERKLVSLTSGRLIGLSWSHDGRWLATAGDLADRGNGIHVVPAEGGDLRTFLRSTPPEFFSAPAFSPDGRQLAFGACTAAVRCHLKLVGIGAGLALEAPVLTLTTQPGPEVGTIAWSRDGRFLVYSSAGWLWRVPVDASRTPERIDLAGIGAETPTIARARDRLAFALERTTLSIYTLDATSTSPPVLASSAWDFDVQFSPDGQRLAFASTRSGDVTTIWTARSDGSGARQLITDTGSYQGSPAWSPDGRWIAFDYRHDDGSWSLFVVDADGGAPRQLTTDAGDENVPVWSRDGQWVYYTSDQKAGRNVWRIPARGGRSQQITTTGSRYRQVLSPDGTEVFFQPGARSQADEELRSPAPLLAVPATGGAAPRLVLPCVADFATNVEGIYYVACGGTTEHPVHFVDAITKRDQVIGKTRHLDTVLTSTLAPSPDGRTVLVPRQTHTADLMLIDNFPH